MTTATLTTKGQITIPAEVRKDLKVDAGATQEVTELKGMFGPAKKTVSIQAMNAAFTGLRATAR